MRTIGRCLFLDRDTEGRTFPSIQRKSHVQENPLTFFPEVALYSAGASVAGAPRFMQSSHLPHRPWKDVSKATIDC